MRNIEGAPALPTAPEVIDTGLQSLVMLLAYHDLPSDPDQLKREFSPRGEPFDAFAIVRAARASSEFIESAASAS